MASIRVKRGTRVAFEAATLLALGEVGFVTDQNAYYVGDGSTANANLIAVGTVILASGAPTLDVHDYKNRLYQDTATGLMYISDGTAWNAAGVSDLSELSGDLDDVDDGTTYGRVANTELDGSGHVSQVNDGTNVKTAAEIKGHIDDVTNNIHEITLQKAVTQGGNLSSGDVAVGAGVGFTINDAPVNPLDAANRAYVDQTKADMSFQPDVLDIQEDDTLNPGASPTLGDRYILIDTGNLHANFGTITGVGDNDIVEYAGSEFIVAYDVSVRGEGALVWDRDTDKWYDWSGIAWGEHGGLSGVTAGGGLDKTANTIFAGDADKGVQVNADDLQVDASEIAGDGLEQLSGAGNEHIIQVDLKASAGLKIDTGELAVEPADIAGIGLEDDGSDNLRLAAQGNGLAGGAGATLSVDPDATTGGGVMPVTVGANGVGITHDTNDFSHTGGTLGLNIVDGGPFV